MSDTDSNTSDWPDRWSHVEKILERTGPFADPEFQPGKKTTEFLFSSCRVLVVGAGGLGCELLKNLALMGFKNIEVIDMDKIEISNLNRQFLFRPQDVGESKAEIAANFINNRIPGCNVIPHYNKIEEFDATFYSKFHIIVCGLDSVVARRWMNGMLINMLEYEDGMLDQGSIIPLIDGGTEGFKGNARVIIPRTSPCIDCNLDLYTTQVNYPLCTIAHTPRLPEHCIEYVKVLQWPKEQPFDDNTEIDVDNPDHINWIFEKAKKRADEYKIQGLTYRLTQGVIKHIIPAVASTNAVIAAVCATEVFKLATSCNNYLKNYMVFNDSDGIYTYSYEAEKKENCLACSQVPKVLTFSESDKLQTIIDYLINNPEYQMRSPGLTTNVNGRNRTLYMQNVPSIEQHTRPNLKMTIKELGLVEGQEIVVADVTSPNSIVFQLHLETKVDDVE